MRKVIFLSSASRSFRSLSSSLSCNLILSRLFSFDSSSTLPQLGSVLNHFTSRMKQANLAYGHGTNCAEDDACFLLKSVLNIPGDSLDLTRMMTRRLSKAECNALTRAFFLRSRRRIPTPYLVGESWLGGLKFKVSRDVLIPRSFIMECLKPPEHAQCAQDLHSALGETAVRSVVDVGTGSGCLAVLLARAFPQAKVYGVDVCSKALQVARFNVERHSLQSRISLVQSDLLSSSTFYSTRFDLIVSNPPYVESSTIRSLPPEYKVEPTKALAGGGRDGLDIVRRLLKTAPSFLTQNGVLICEVGGRRAALERSLPSQKFKWLRVSGGTSQVFLVHRQWLKT